MYISVTYDISQTKARNKVVQLLERYGFRVQKSVFELEIKEPQFRGLKLKLEDILRKANIYYQNQNMDNLDSIKFYILSKVWEWSLDGRIEGLWTWYEKIYFPDIMIL